MTKINQKIALHPEIKEISFKHKFVIQHVFEKSILGTFGIDYFSLMIIDASNILSIYSSSPALEFNLINEDLWLYDGIFDPKNHIDGAFYFWDELYSNSLKNILTQEKEGKLGFSFGFCMIKKINDMFVIYSFATKSQLEKAVYRDSNETLVKIGDWFFNELKSVHRQYVVHEKESSLSPTLSTSLRLIVDNTVKKLTHKHWVKQKGV